MITYVRLDKLRGEKLPGCDWVVGDWCTRGVPSDKTPGYRAYREFATNDWQDFRVDAVGLVEVQDDAPPPPPRVTGANTQGVVIRRRRKAGSR